MAIHDIGKNQSDRSSPVPNSHDTTGVPLMAKGTNSVNYTTAATTQANNDPIRLGFKRQVYTGTTKVTWGVGGTTTTTAVAHPLGYAPLVEGAINHATFSGAISLTDVNLPLPTWVAFDNSGTAPQFTTYMSILADASNVYIITINGSAGSTGSLFVTYYLYEQRIV